MMFFYFLKIIFDISILKWSKTYKPYLILIKKNFKFFRNAATAAFPNFGFSEIHTQPILILHLLPFFLTALINTIEPKSLQQIQRCENPLSILSRPLILLFVLSSDACKQSTCPIPTFSNPITAAYFLCVSLSLIKPNQTKPNELNSISFPFVTKTHKK